jgi:hypothetical protein
MLCDLGPPARLEDQLPLALRITATLEGERGASGVSPHRFGPLLPGGQPLGPQAPGRLLDGSHGDRRSDVALMVDDGQALLALLRLRARVAQPLPPCLQGEVF